LGTGRLFHHWATYLAFSPDGKLLASVDTSGSVRLWQVNTGKELWEAQTVRRGNHSPEWSPLAFSTDSKMLACGTFNDLRRGKEKPTGSVYLWDVSSGRELRKITGFAGNPTVIRFTPDGRLVVNCWQYQGGEISLWNPKTGEQLAHSKGSASHLAVSA